MTTLGLLRRRFYQGLLAFIAWMVALAIWHENVPHTHQFDLATAAIAPVGFLAMEAYWWFTPCVTCHRAIGWRACTWKLWWVGPRKCPHCGVSIDRDAPG